MAVLTRTDLHARGRQRLDVDPDVRQALLAGPRAAVPELLGMPLPDLVAVTDFDSWLVADAV